MLFMGEYSHTIDAKGRLIVPAKFREGLGEHFVVTKGLDGCLYAYSDEAWEELVSKLKALPQSRRDSRRIIRYFMAGATDAEYDKQGRILLPASLRKHANLTKEVTLVGAGNRVEIWDTALWNEEEPDNIEEMAESLGELGFDF